MITDQEVEEATARMEAMRATIPHAITARYDRAADRIIVALSSKIEVMFNPAEVQGLDHATPSQLEEIEITPSGFGLYFPLLDEGINVPNLLEGTLGSRKWMAARLGAEGGKARSLAKRTAARANGALGGRPRKSPAKSGSFMVAAPKANRRKKSA